MSSTLNDQTCGCTPVQSDKLGQQLGSQTPRLLVLRGSGGYFDKVYRSFGRQVFGWWNSDWHADWLRVTQIDTDPKMEGLYPPGAFYDLGRVRFRKLLARMREDSQAYANLQRLGNFDQLWRQWRTVSVITGGALQDGTVSFACLNDHLERQPATLINFMKAPLQELNAYGGGQLFCGDGHVQRGDGSDGSKPGPGLTEFDQEGRLQTICYVGSTFGGQGRGTIKTLADLDRDLLEELGLDELGVGVQAILALPSAYPEIADQLPLRANHQAFMQELRERFHRALPPLDFKTTQVSRDWPPFFPVYLQGGRNLKGQGVADSHQAAQISAAFLRMTATPSALAAQYNADVENVLHRLSSPYVASDFAPYSLYLDREASARQYAVWCSQEEVDEYLLRPPLGGQQVQQQVRGWLAETGISQGWRQFFLVDKDGEPLRQDLADLPRRYQGKELTRAIGAYEQHLSQQQPVYQRLRKRIAEQLVQNLSEWVLQIVNQDGLRQALLALEGQPEQQIRGLVWYLARDHQGVLNRLAQIQQQRTSTPGRQRKRRLGLPRLNWPKLAWFADRRWQQQRLKQLHEVESQLELASILGVIKDVEQRVAWHIQELKEGWLETLPVLSERLAAEAQEMDDNRVRHRSIVEEPVWCEADEQAFYQRNKDAAFAWAKRIRFGLKPSTNEEPAKLELLYPPDAGVAGEGTDRWKVLSEEGIKRYAAYPLAFWQRALKDLSVEQILADKLKKQGQTVMDLLAYLENQAVPWISGLDQDVPVIELKHLATQHGGNGLLKGFHRPGLTLVATGERGSERLDFLVTHHGIDLACIQEELHEQAYQYQRKNRLMHIYPEEELTLTNGQGQGAGQANHPSSEEQEAN